MTATLITEIDTLEVKVMKIEDDEDGVVNLNEAKPSSR